MKKYEYTGMDVSTPKRVDDGASYYIEAVRRYLKAEKFPQVETIAAILGLQKVEENRKEGEKENE